MKRSARLLALLLTLAACGSGDSGATTTTTPEAGPTTQPPSTTTTHATTTTEGTSAQFPVTIQADNGSVTVEGMPEAIVSLSSTATEMLFAIGAGSQLVAVDDQSNYPAEAPMTDLSGFTPNVEAILSYEPDLVVIGYDPGELVASLEAADVPVINYSAAMTIDDVYHQIEALGAVTGHGEDATTVSESIADDLASIAEEAPDAEGVTYYHELDNTLFTATSTTFFGQIYGLFGIENIADAADEDGSAFGYPQLSSEYVVAADPDIIFLADALYGESSETIAARPGWDVLSAVQTGNVVELDSDIASRWGPRIVDFAQSVSDAIEAYVGQG
ncbi:MAG TPA: ABC transporter substrate-binding protein [Acidimicrobiia bacterium]